MKNDNESGEEANLDPNINMSVDPVRTPVLYADSIHIKSDKNGVVLDFAQQIGSSNQYNVVARIGMSKDHAKDLIEHLEALLRSDGSRSTKKSD